MFQQNGRYAKARLVFGAVFVVSVGVLVVFLVIRGLESDPSGTNRPNTSEGQASNIVGIVTLLTSITSLIGLVSTTILRWREEQREAGTAELERQRRELEIDKLKLELEQLKAKDGEEKGDT